MYPLQAGFYSGGQGNPGIVSIKARDTVSFAGRDSGVFTNVEPMAVGNGSDVLISARRSVSFSDGAILEASNAGRGNGGNITIQTGTLSIDGSDARSTLLEGGVGNAGDINISTRSLYLTNRGQLSTSNAGSGAAGNINITTAQDIRLDNEGSIRADTRGGQGNISVRSGDFILSRNSKITTNATGNNVIGGNIKIDSDILAAVGNSNISANSADSRGGQVTINTQGIFLSPDSAITATGASSFLNGNVQISASEVEASLGLVTLPTITENTPRLVSSSCAAFADQGGSKFTVTGRSGLPPSPDEFLTSDVVWTDARLPETIAQQHIAKKHIASQLKAVEILPATGWVLNSNGDITLVSNTSGANIGATPTSCPK
ncbi:MAG: hypothetical protein PUP91_29555 [Rhizonema sp. PD37]|nr:hypothetical protein [Rhizonema sp. PD37]